MEFEWVQIAANTYRAKVFGGWIVQSDDTSGNALCFIPDREHIWVVKHN